MKVATLSIKEMSRALYVFFAYYVRFSTFLSVFFFFTDNGKQKVSVVSEDIS